MNVMKIRGGIPLRGTVRTQGAKNAALPLNPKNFTYTRDFQILLDIF